MNLTQMNLEFQAITEKEKEKKKYKNSMIRLQTSKTKYSWQNNALLSCNYTEITQISQAK